MSDEQPEARRWLRTVGDTAFTRKVVDRVVELVGDEHRAMELLTRCAAIDLDPIPLAEKYRKNLDDGIE